MAALMSLAVGDRVVWTDLDHAPGSAPMPMSGEVVDATEGGWFVVLYDGYRHLPPGTPARRASFTLKDVHDGRFVREDEYLARPFARRPWTGDQ